MGDAFGVDTWDKKIAKYKREPKVELELTQMQKNVVQVALDHLNEHLTSVATDIAETDDDKSDIRERIQATEEIQMMLKSE